MSDEIYVCSIAFTSDGFEILRKLDSNGNIINSFGSGGIGVTRLSSNGGSYLSVAKNGYLMGSSLMMASPDGKRTKEIYSGYGDLKFSSDGYIFNLNSGLSKNDTSKSWPHSEVLGFGIKGNVSLLGNSESIQLNSHNSVFVSSNKEYISLSDSSYIYKLKPDNGAFFNNFGKAGTQYITFPEGKNRLEAMGEIIDKYVYLSGKVDGTAAGSFALCKLDTNGNYVNSFGKNGRLLIPMEGTDASSNALLVNSKNEVFAAGYTTVAGQKQLAIIKLKDQPLSVEDLHVKETEVQIYPNPSKDVFYIKNPPEGASVNIYNSLGLKVLSKSLKAQQTVNLAEFSAGNYVMEIVSETYRKVFKIELQ
ncbi:MAG: T9SS type A sorting domain-containing protein [Opitutaceae bacterium]|nr:T9SS type A sorting domain-containing protein [Cytophagales bacterium]